MKKSFTELFNSVFGKQELPDNTVKFAAINKDMKDRPRRNTSPLDGDRVIHMHRHNTPNVSH